MRWRHLLRVHPRYGCWILQTQNRDVQINTDQKTDADSENFWKKKETVAFTSNALLPTHNIFIGTYPHRNLMMIILTDYVSTMFRIMAVV